MGTSCDTPDGFQSFVTPSGTDPLRTPDGRTVPGSNRSAMTADQYHAEIRESLIMSQPGDKTSGRRGDEAGALILKMIGPNALTPDETRNVLSIVRTAFDKPSAKDPSQTLILLQTLGLSTGDDGLKQQIAETAAYVRAR